MSKPAGALTLTPGSDIQAAMSAAPAGSTFWFEAGTYRLESPIVPKDGQSFLGARGAVLDGSSVLDGFESRGSHFVASGQTQEGLRLATAEGAEGAERAGYPETVFVDGAPLSPVANLADLKSGHFYFDYQANEIVLADDPSGHVVEAGHSAAAFESNASDVTISNLVVQHFNAPTQHGAIQGGGSGWTVENNEVRFNYGVGITVQDGGTIAGNDVHDNGQMGVGASGNGVVVENNELAHNGFWSGIDPNWEGGGSKFGEATDLVVRDNYAHDNHGYGLWTDENSKGVLYEGNLVVDNDAGGISHEISYDATIRDNTLVGNGEATAGNWLWGAQIQVQNSQNVEVSGNRVDMSGGVNGIALIQQDRGEGPLGDHLTTGNTVHDNVIVSRSGDGATGGVADYREETLLDGGNTFADNTYAMADGDHWRWGDFPSGDNWEAYLRDSGQDGGSTLSQSAPDTSSWLTQDAGSSGGTGPVQTAPDGVAASPAGSVPTSTAPLDLEGTSGADHLTGGTGNDVLFAGRGDDIISGGLGSDVFCFEVDSGADRITDFSVDPTRHDVVMLPDDYFATPADALGSATASGHDVVLSYGHNTLTLENVSLSQLNADFFLVG